MDSITRWWTRSLTSLVLVLGLLLAGAAQASGGLSIDRGHFQLDQGVWVLDADLDVRLTEPLYDALTSGVTLHVKHEVRVMTERSWWRPDAETARLTFRLDLTYHSLTRRYVLHNRNSGRQTSHNSLGALLRAVETLRDLPIIDQGLLDPEQSHYGELESRISVDTLPLALRPLDWFANHWRLTSEPVAWPLGI